MKILLTGFEPFGGEETNPSWDAVASLPTSLAFTFGASPSGPLPPSDSLPPSGASPSDPLLSSGELFAACASGVSQRGEQCVELAKLRLPVSFRRAPEIAAEAIGRLRPDVVICVGQAGGRACVSIERIAVNLANAKKPDADGFRPVNNPVAEGGPAAIFSTLPVDTLVEAVRAAGIPCHPSESAGLYVCNTLLYTLLHRFPSLPVTFVHLPYTPAQAVKKGKDTPSMSLPDMTAALSAVISAIN